MCNRVFVYPLYRRDGKRMLNVSDMSAVAGYPSTALVLRECAKSFSSMRTSAADNEFSHGKIDVKISHSLNLVNNKQLT